MVEELCFFSLFIIRYCIFFSCFWKSIIGEIGVKSGCEWCLRGELGYSLGSVGDGKFGMIKVEVIGI